jgi:hypothetical protein
MTVPQMEFMLSKSSFLTFKLIKYGINYSQLFAIILILIFTSENHAQRQCGNDHDIDKIKRNEPQRYQEHLKIEKHTQDYIQKMKSGNSAYRLGDENSVIIIPVVVHILHSPGEGIGVGSNLSVAQIQSQIDVINEDYSRTNADAPLAIGLPKPFTRAGEVLLN